MRSVSRRSVLKTSAAALACAASPRLAFAASEHQAFEVLLSRAAYIAARPFISASTELPAAFSVLDYDGFRRLRPRDESAIWRDERHGFSILPLPRGYLFREPIKLTFNEAGVPRPLTGSDKFIDFVDYPAASAADRAALGVSGWRLLQRNAVGGGRHECAVFQGGAYFRAVAAGLAYGLSARGLAIRTGANEEFPAFREFEIFSPVNGAGTVTAFALLDSPSVAGAYRFDIAYGEATTMDVTATLFPRADLTDVGIAPMSSMFLRGASDKALTADERPQVHDSDGLCIRSARGEWLWRALANARASQVSAFREPSVAGFGLLQRQRNARAYNDSEARYESRPSLWVEPQGDWGAGHVILIEFPTDDEYDDNIVAFWKPDAVLRAGARYTFRYRLTWNGAGPQSAGRVLSSTLHSSAFNIDFDRPFVSGDAADVSASFGAVSDVRVAAAASGVTRVSFTAAANGASPIELRAALKSVNGRPASETWLFRWTPD